MKVKSSVSFDAKSHTYTHKTLGKFISVTTLLGKYKEHFDANKHATRVAQREGVPKEMILELWENEKNKACERGTNIHELLENYINFGDTEENYMWLYKTYNNIVERCIDRYDKVLSENLLYDEDFKVAGTADLIYEHKDEFTIADFKTNKKFRFSSAFNEKLLPPVDHLHNCEFNIYALQLSMYAFMYEKLTGKKCRKCVIFYLKEDKFIPYHVNYLKSDIQALLDAFKKSAAAV